MLDTVFLQIFDMTKVAGIVILIVFLVRLCLKKAPKVFSYVLWAVVLFRLLCPVSIEAPISLIPDMEPTIQEYSETPVQNVPEDAAVTVETGYQIAVDPSDNTVKSYQNRDTSHVFRNDAEYHWLTVVWLAGIAVMLVYSGISYGKLRSKLLTSTKLRGNICIADHIDSPFVLGLLHPKIYLPSSLTEKERGYIILHEQHHIRRGDHIIKLLSYTALCLHWFNPLVWIAFILSGKDMEMSCDEAVLRRLGKDIRVDYSTSLISLATGRRIIAGTPLAFGEGNTEGRIRNIAKWKKPTAWVIVITGIVCVVILVCLITNPMSRDTMLMGAEYQIDEILYRTSDEYDHVDNDSPSVCITADYCLWERNGDGNWEFVGKMEPYTLDQSELDDYTAYADGWVRQYSTGEITDSYILRIEGETSHNFFLAFRTKKGDILLGYGIEDVSERGQGASDDTSLYWMCRLESTFDSYGNTGMFFDRSLAHTVGGDVDIFHTWTNANKPGYIIVGFKSDDSEYSDAIVVPSPEKTDMGFAVFYHSKDESGYRLLQCHVYEDAALAENGIYLCPDPAVLDLSGEMKSKVTYDVILLNNDSIGKATRIWEYADGSTETQTASYLIGHEMVLYSWENDKAETRVWQYFYDEHGGLIDYSSIVKDESALNIRTWVDYYHTPEKMDWDIVNQTTIPDYPGVTFSYTSGQIYATVDFEAEQPDAGHSILISGMPIWNAFFSDLNGDGLAEICATVSYGSGIIDTHVVVFDYKTGKEYTLWERGVNEYSLREVNGQLICDKWTYPDGEVVDYGMLVIEDGALKLISGIVDMVPTAANVTGAFDAYLYVPIDGANYRYERIYDDPASVTKDVLIHNFTEEAEPDNIDWRVYSVDEYPDRSVVLAEAGDDFVHLYRYSPSKAVDPDGLTAAKASGMIVLEDGDVTFGQELWNTFYTKVQDGKAASVKAAHYYTLENGNYDATYYEVYKEDYPALYTFDLTYDGETFTLSWDDNGTPYLRQYKYLMRYEDTIPSHGVKPRSVISYVLTNDDTVTWDDLTWGLASSQLGDYIEHYTIYIDIG